MCASGFLGGPVAQLGFLQVEELKERQAHSPKFGKPDGPRFESGRAHQKNSANPFWWDVNTAYPLLLKLYEIHSEGALPMNDFATGLELIESFLVRRLVLNYSARSLNRYFPAISKSVDKGNVLGSLVQGLTNYGWPDDNAFT